RRPSKKPRPRAAPRRWALAPAASADAAGGDVRGVAGRLAAVRGRALVDTAGKAVDQPGAFLVGCLEADIALADRADQRRQQDRSRDHRCADHDRHGVHGTRLIGGAWTIALVFTVPLN